MRGKLFTDRKQAGQLLADEVERRDYSDPVVLGLPRGGVPVAAEVAMRLKAPLDIVLVRKIGAPFQPELAMGAVVDGDDPEFVRNKDVISGFGITEIEFQKEAERQLKIIEARRKLWLKDRPRASLKDKTVIVVDDGIATGATIRASLHALKKRGPKRLVIATPVAPASTAELLRQDAEEVICLAAPEYFGAIGFFYLDFSQVSDAEVAEILDRVSQGVSARATRP